MKFQVFDLHQCKRGQAVLVTLRGNAANVRLLDSSGLSAFKRGARHTIHGGGHVTRSPYRMVIPRDGHWYVTVDFGGYAGRTKVSVSVEPAPSQRILPPARCAQPPDPGAHGLGSAGADYVYIATASCGGDLDGAAVPEDSAGYG